MSRPCSWVCSSSPTIVDFNFTTDNPLGSERLPHAAVLTEVLLYASDLVAIGSVLMRLRRSRGEERQQIKWFAYAGALLALSTIITYVLSEATTLW